MTETIEQKNLRLVQDLCTVWSMADYRPELMIPYFTDDCTVRLMHTLPVAHGPVAVAEQARSLMPLGTERILVKYLSTYTTGPMVVTHRIDTFVVPGKPDSDWEMLGVFLISNSKIKEWTDFMLTPVGAP